MPSGHKKIGLDARLIAQTGVGVYIRNLIYHLASLDLTGVHFSLFISRRDKHLLPKDLPPAHFSIYHTESRWHSLSEQTVFLSTLMTRKLDLMHFTYFSLPVLYARPFVITIHDLTPLLFKTGRASTHEPIVYNLKHTAYRFLMSQAVHRARHIITPTQTVRDEILRHYPTLDPSTIESVYEGISENIIKTQENRGLAEKYKKPFFLYVGNFYPHKNVERLISAFAQTNVKERLILVGPKDYFSTRILQSINRLKVSSRIDMYHDATLQDLVFFYKNASALIHPSLSEGFGLPIVEAAYFNLPLIASDILVFRELMGRNYLAFDPHDESDIARKMSGFSEGKSKPSPLISRSDLTRRFSFQKMAEETLAIYKRSLT